ncbi:MFS transporter [Cellulosimicrobium funkei]|nr:MFS transporter [Cellulosimicrobium funkei]
MGVRATHPQTHLLDLSMRRTTSKRGFPRQPRWWRLALSIQAALTQASWVGVRLMAGYRALELDADGALLGIVAATFALPGLLGALTAGRLADRYGGALLATAGLIAAISATAVMLLAGNLLSLLCGTFLTGLGHLLVIIGHQSTAAQHSGDRGTDQAFGTLTAAISVGQLIGPPAVTTAGALLGTAIGLDQSDAQLGLSMSLGLAFLSLPLSLALPPSARRQTGTSVTNRRQWGSSITILRSPGMWRSLTVGAVVVVAVDLLYAFLPLWATHHGIPPATVGLLLALRAAVAVVSRIGLAVLVQRLGRKYLLVTALAIGTGSFLLLSVPHQLTAVIAMIGLGIGLGIPQPLTMAWVVGLTAPHLQGTALGLRMTFSRLAQTSIPATVGATSMALGTSGVFWISAAMVAGACALTAYSQPDRGPRPGTVDSL